MFKQLIVFTSLFVFNYAEVSQILIAEDHTELPPPPKPYAFGYAAGRFPGHIDRTHSEVSDGSGIVQGSYSYVDPSYKIRTVDYIADKNGFHASLSHPSPALPSDTAAVKAAKERHALQYASIAQAHQIKPGYVIVPVDSVAVQKATAKHFTLFEKIAAEHARIAAERAAIAATAEPNHLEEY